jgi:hypothetical protein
MKPEACCILNGGGGAWAFEALARQLSAALWVDISETPRAYNYLLSLDDLDAASSFELFIPLRSMQLAADKRLLADLFNDCGVPTPETHLAGSLAEAEQLLRDEPRMVHQIPDRLRGFRSSYAEAGRGVAERLARASRGAGIHPT